MIRLVPMFVMTIDQRHSRRSADLIDEVLETLADDESITTVRAFQRTAGDELQGVLASAAAVLAVVERLGRTGRWSIGIGVGTVRTPMPQDARAGGGPAYEHARDAVTRAKRASGSVALTADGTVAADRVEAMLQLVVELDRRRSDSGQQAGELIGDGLTQAEAAERLGTTQQAVSQRLRRGLWQECRRVMSAAGEMMAELDGRDSDDADGADAPDDAGGAPQED